MSASRYVFCELQYESGKMTSDEMSLYKNLYAKLSWKPDIIIYIRTDPSVSMERMVARNRDCESNVPFEYLKSVHEKYEQLSIENKDIVMIVDGNRTSDEVYQDVLKIIKSFI
jgi:thymidylate kinase